VDLAWVSFGFLLDLSWILCWVLYWIFIGPLLDLCWISVGSLLDLYWISSGSLLDFKWISFGSLLSFYWISLGFCVGSMLDLGWISIGSLLDLHVTSIGSLLDLYWTLHQLCMHFYYLFVTIWSISSILLGVFEGTINSVGIFTRRGWGHAKARQPAWIQVGHHMDLNLSLLEPFNVPLLGNKGFTPPHPTPPHSMPGPPRG
jgi:hypothetical protein